MPRPTVYTARIGRELVALVESGLPLRTAAGRCGIGRRTVYEWLERGRRGLKPFARFVREFERAQAVCEGNVIMEIVAAAEKDWRAGAWWLERRFPKRYSTKQTMRLEKSPNELTDTELEAELERLGFVHRDRLAELGYVRH